jgi:hypothetical protein
MKKIILTICLFAAIVINAQKTYDFTVGNTAPWVKAGNSISADQSSEGLTLEFNAGNPRLDITAGADPYDASTLTHLIVTLENNSSEVGTMSGFFHENDGDNLADDGTQFLGFDTQVTSGLGTYIIDLTSANYNNDEADLGGVDDPNVIIGNDTDGIANMEYVGIRFRNSAGSVLTGTSAVNGNIIIKKIQIVAESSIEKLHYNFNTEGVSTWSNQTGTTVTDGSTTLDIALDGTTTSPRVQETFYMQDPANATYVHVFIESNTSGYNQIKFQYTKDTNPSNFKTSGAKSAAAGVVTYSLTNAEWVTTNSGVKKTIRLQFSATGALSAGTIKISRVLFNNSANINNWEGTNTNWSDSSNWSKGSLPTATEDVFVSTTSNNPIIEGTTGAEALNLSVESNATLAITSGGSLIVAGTSAGNVTYNLDVTDTGWHLVSSPVSGEGYDNDWVTANSVALGTNDNRGIATYQNGAEDTDTDGGGTDTATGNWVYMQADDSDTFGSGVGYSLKRTTGGTYAFTGTVPTTTLTPTITQSVNNWNLIGNSFPSYLDVGAFVTANTANLGGLFQAVYIWNGTAYVETTDSYLQPGQAFFVSSNVASGTASITEAMQSHRTGITFHKSSNTSIKLNITNGTSSRETKINYLDGKTKGIDPGFDIGMFNGVSSDLRIFTHLLDNNDGTAIARQALPNSNLESMVIPVGVQAKAGKQITFSAEALNVPDGIKVFLEDRETNTFTRLDEANTKYEITLTENLNGVGRFYIHTSAKSALSIDNANLETVRIHKLNNSTLRIAGLSQGKASVKLFNLLGKQVMHTSFEAATSKDLALPNLATGIYIVQLETEGGKLNKKIILE